MWARPEKGQIMMNCDGYVSTILKGFDGVLKELQGDVKMVFFSNQGNNSVIEPELREVVRVKLCAPLEFRKVCVASDSLRVYLVMGARRSYVFKQSLKPRSQSKSLFLVHF